MTCNDALNISKCSSCPQGYILSSDKCVRQCNVIGCAICIAGESNRCSKCNQGFVLHADDKCIKCPKSCTGQCLTSDPNICLECVDGYLINNTCKSCPLGCLKCN